MILLVTDVSEKLFENGVCLPCDTKMTDEDLERVVEIIKGLWVKSNETVSKGGIYRRFIKRPMDFILSLIAIIVLSPVFLIVAILVRTNLGSPVII